jgi:hypothetical protein
LYLLALGVAHNRFGLSEIKIRCKGFQKAPIVLLRKIRKEWAIRRCVHGKRENSSKVWHQLRRKQKRWTLHWTPARRNGVYRRCLSIFSLFIDEVVMLEECTNQEWSCTVFQGIFFSFSLRPPMWSRACVLKQMHSLFGSHDLLDLFLLRLVGNSTSTGHRGFLRFLIDRRSDCRMDTLWADAAQ